MKILALVFLILTVIAQFRIWTADMRWSDLFVARRSLDNMSAYDKFYERPEPIGAVGVWTYRIRNVSGIGTIVFGLLAFLT